MILSVKSLHINRICFARSFELEAQIRVPSKFCPIDSDTKVESMEMAMIKREPKYYNNNNSI